MESQESILKLLLWNVGLPGHSQESSHGVPVQNLGTPRGVPEESQGSPRGVPGESQVTRGFV